MVSQDTSVENVVACVIPGTGWSGCTSKVASSASFGEEPGIRVVGEGGSSESDCSRRTGRESLTVDGTWRGAWSRIAIGGIS